MRARCLSYSLCQHSVFYIIFSHIHASRARSGGCAHHQRTTVLRVLHHRLSLLPPNTPLALLVQVVRGQCGAATLELRRAGRVELRVLHFRVHLGRDGRLDGYRRMGGLEGQMGGNSYQQVGVLPRRLHHQPVTLAVVAQGVQSIVAQAHVVQDAAHPKDVVDGLYLTEEQGAVQQVEARLEPAEHALYVLQGVAATSPQWCPVSLELPG